jgi:hypothetical protein
MKQPQLRATLLALAAAAVFTASARAYTAGDFVIGFRQAGNATDIAGSVTLANFTSVQTFDLGVVGSSFSTVFNNPNWFNDASILWGVAATNGVSGAGAINFISSPETVGGSESTALTGKAQTTTGTVAGRITGAGNGTMAPFTTTPIGSGIVGTQDLSSNTQAWQRYMTGGNIAGSTDWGFYGTNGTQANFGNGVAGQTLDIYRLPVGNAIPGLDLGDFSLSYNSGTGDMMLTFTPDSFEAIPEPSTYALLLLGMIGLLPMYVQRRRAAGIFLRGLFNHAVE